MRSVVQRVEALGQIFRLVFRLCSYQCARDALLTEASTRIPVTVAVIVDSVRVRYPQIVYIPAVRSREDVGASAGWVGTVEPRVHDGGGEEVRSLVAVNEAKHGRMRLASR